MRQAIRLSLCLALAGCVGMVTTQEISTSGRKGNDWNYFTMGGSLPLDVLGNPTAQPADRFRRDFAALMSRSVIGQPVTFDAEAGAAARGGVRVAVLFGNAATSFGTLPCDLTENVAPASRDPIIMHAALCDGSEAMRAVRGTTRVADGGPDGALRALAAQVLLELTSPRRTGGRDGGEGGSP